VQAARATASRKPPLLVKLAPDLADDDLPEVVRVILAHSADGIVVSNTTIARGGLRDLAFARQTGGLSGRPLFARSTRMLARVYRLTGGKLPLIGVGGIDSGEAALAKIGAGASLLQLYTGLVFEGPDLIGRIKQTLVEALEGAGADNLKPLIGTRAEQWAERKLD
jgi:dihydroorotate dehydrogenase